jgi:hypothetical protein
MSLERAKSLASEWISLGQGIIAVTPDEWTAMSERARADGLSPVPLPRDVMRNEAGAEGKALNDMVIANKYDTFRMDLSSARLNAAKNNIRRYFPYFSEVAARSYTERKTAAEGAMQKLDPNITGGTGGIRIEQIPDIMSDTFKEVGIGLAETGRAIPWALIVGLVFGGLVISNVLGGRR